MILLISSSHPFVHNSNVETSNTYIDYKSFFFFFYWFSYCIEEKGFWICDVQDFLKRETNVFLKYVAKNLKMSTALHGH